MELIIFFTNREDRMQFMKNHLKIEAAVLDKGEEFFEKIDGMKSIKLKNRVNTIPGFWLELNFLETEKGEKLYNLLCHSVDSSQMRDNVFYPKENLPLKDLEAGWSAKYNLTKRESQEEIWKLFYQEIKSHIKYDRIDIAYKGFTLFLKYNPFFLKKYKRYYILEDLAYLYENIGNVGKAIKCLKMQAVLQPNSIEPYLNISSFYIINGMEEEAYQICQEALKKSPENQYLISNLIIALINIGNLEYAVDFLEEVLEKNPNNAYFWKLMGDILYEMEDNKGAIDCYQKALKIGKNPGVDDFKLDIHTGIGDCHYEEENYTEAVTQYRKALNYNPKDPYLLLNLGQIHFFKLKDTKKAFKYTSLLVENMPENGYGQYQLGLIYSHLGNIEKAIWHLYRARSIIPYYKPIHDAINLVKKNNKKYHAY
ncbi:Tetratricopeptide repeat-containing protein [Natronincola peptidivorans]|uniref:Tetratricopeptide repeat-containing protein n=1 Tax=Natronincola peptidivorans TaxID=426128 RepID=A0A1I0EC78_9FIRM|nr:tetratricopeptide repeat protein [Natronincola peptidivorans]SET42057.1 Tetratricopeptide repeat-containing protein [Natronincola peptidivorans]